MNDREPIYLAGAQYLQLDERQRKIFLLLLQAAHIQGYDEACVSIAPILMGGKRDWLAKLKEAKNA